MLSGDMRYCTCERVMMAGARGGFSDCDVFYMDLRWYVDCGRKKGERREVLETGYILAIGNTRGGEGGGKGVSSITSCQSSSKKQTVVYYVLSYHMS